MQLKPHIENSNLSLVMRRHALAVGALLIGYNQLEDVSELTDLG